MGTTGDAAGIWANPVVHRFSAANPMQIPWRTDYCKQTVTTCLATVQKKPAMCILQTMNDGLRIWDATTSQPVFYAALHVPAESDTL